MSCDLKKNPLCFLPRRAASTVRPTPAVWTSPRSQSGPRAAPRSHVACRGQRCDRMFKQSNMSDIQLHSTVRRAQNQTERDPVTCWPCLSQQNWVHCAALRTVRLQQWWVTVNCVEARQSSRSRAGRTSVSQHRHVGLNLTRSFTH